MDGARIPSLRLLSPFCAIPHTLRDPSHTSLQVHRNARDISTLWKGCPHLGSELQKELLLKVAWVRRMESKGMKSYPKRFQSAEGCYSHAACLLYTSPSPRDRG